jgi:chemotaxis signal transduction protein
VTPALADSEWVFECPFQRNFLMSKPRRAMCQTHQLVTFFVLGKRYGISKESLRAVIPLESADYSAVEGFGVATARIRGDAFPVLDVLGLAGENPHLRPGRILIALRTSRGDVGIVADRLDSVVTYEAEQISPAWIRRGDPLEELVIRTIDPLTSGPAIGLLDPTRISSRAQPRDRTNTQAWVGPGPRYSN